MSSSVTSAGGSTTASMPPQLALCYELHRVPQIQVSKSELPM